MRPSHLPSAPPGLRRHCTILALALAAPAGFVRADSPSTRPVSQPSAESPTTRPSDSPWEAWLKQDRLTGDWGGVRTDLENIGITFDIFYNQIYAANTRGGLDTTNAQRLSGSFDVLLRLDFEKMNLIPGGSMLLFAKSNWSRNINPKVGALSDPIDDADGDIPIYVDHLHYQQDFLDHKLQLRFGYLDQQLALDRNAYANAEDIQFMSTYLDNNNAIIPLTIGLGATLFINPTDWLGFVIGAADGQAKSLQPGFDTTFHDEAAFFGYFETDFRVKFDSPNGPLPGTYRFGTFYDPRRKERYRNDLDGDLPPKYETGDVGFYMSLDQMIYRETPDDDQGLGLFFRYGYRHGEVNRIGDFWSAGAQYKGLIPNRDHDLLGFGVYSAIGSQQYRRWVDPEFDRETGYEFYYNIEITPWLTLTPDVQYIYQPGGSRDAEDSIVVALRARVTF